MNNWRAVQRAERIRMENQAKATEKLGEELRKVDPTPVIKVIPNEVSKVQYNRLLSSFAGETPERQAAAIKRLKPRHIDLLIEALVVNRPEAMKRRIEAIKDLMEADNISGEELRDYLQSRV